MSCKLCELCCELKLCVYDCRAMVFMGPNLCMKWLLLWIGRAMLIGSLGVQNPVCGVWWSGSSSSSVSRSKREQDALGTFSSKYPATADQVVLSPCTVCFHLLLRGPNFSVSGYSMVT